jgi:hypothetical protein
VKGSFIRKSTIGRPNGGGYYKTEAEAARDVHYHRMLFEGFVKHGGHWFDPVPIADVDADADANSAADADAVGDGRRRGRRPRVAGAAVDSPRRAGSGGRACWAAIWANWLEARCVEFHVESSEAFDAWRATTPFGGHLSVRRLPCQPALIKLGQDESAFSSESASSRHWVVDGRSYLTPKSGISLMVSAFTGGALGFGLTLTDEELEVVNEYRRQPENNTYLCGKYNAPQTLCALGGVPVTDKKPDLKESPGVRMIFNCKAGDGYWTSSHMMVQTEDVADVVRALLPWVNLGGEFDHSGVHAIQKKDALNASKMSAGYGGAQTLKRPTVMTAGCLGPFPAVKSSTAWSTT